MQFVRVSGVTKRFGTVRALDGATFEIGEGVTGLLGSNGAGKTTSLKILIGLIDPDEGSVEVLGRDTRGSVDYRTRIGYSPEQDCLPRAVSAAELLAYLGEISGLPRTAARLRASDILRHVGLFEERYRAIGTYSTGMKQRVKLAQALAHDPVVSFLYYPNALLYPMGLRDMLGAKVGVFRNQGPPLWRRVRADGSYGSANDPRVLVGLGDRATVSRVRVVWPGGRVEDWTDIAVGRWMTLREGSGVQAAPSGL